MKIWPKFMYKYFSKIHFLITNLSINRRWLIWLYASIMCAFGMLKFPEKQAGSPVFMWVLCIFYGYILVPKINKSKYSGSPYALLGYAILGSGLFILSYIDQLVGGVVVAIAVFSWCIALGVPAYYNIFIGLRSIFGVFSECYLKEYREVLSDFIRRFYRH